MTFEQWKTRPIAIVHCFTFQLYKELNLPWFWFRVLPNYRKPQFIEARKKVAQKIKKMRLEGLTHSQVKKIAVAKIFDNSPGDAERVDFEQILEVLS